MNPITPERGFHLFADLLAQDSTQGGVLPINWSQFFKQLPVGTKMPLLEAFTSTVGQSRTGKSDFIQRLEVTPVEERRELLVAHVRKQVAKVLGLDSSEPLDLHQGFFDLGMDSLTLTELRTNLQSSLEVNLSITNLFNYNTTDELVSYLSQDVLGITSSEKLDAASPEALNSAEDLTELSEEELTALLADEIYGGEY